MSSKWDPKLKHQKQNQVFKQDLRSSCWIWKKRCTLYWSISSSWPSRQINCKLCWKRNVMKSSCKASYLIKLSNDKLRISRSSQPWKVLCNSSDRICSTCSRRPDWHKSRQPWSTIVLIRYKVLRRLMCRFLSQLNTRLERCKNYSSRLGCRLSSRHHIKCHLVCSKLCLSKIWGKLIHLKVTSVSGKNQRLVLIVRWKWFKMLMSRSAI